MSTVITRQGKRIEIISEHDLRNPFVSGNYVRAYCHIHGSDHQRSLSINRSNGWGRCFNAACAVTVIVAEWNPSVAARLLRYDERLYLAENRAHSSARPRRFEPVLQTSAERTQRWQQDEMHALQTLQEQMELALIRSPRAQRYLQDRGISMEVAWEAGVGYLAPELVTNLSLRGQRALMQRWSTRLIFPLTSPHGRGYIGRSLWLWRPGMNENVHKSLLEQPGGTRRWIKTNPAGWFGNDVQDLATELILVEGAFDRLTLLSAGFASSEVIALAGTSLHLDWIPEHVKTVVLAFDGDEGGREAMERLANQLSQRDLHVELCPPPLDRWGKDWNERWRRIGQESIWPLRETFYAVKSAS